MDIWEPFDIESGQALYWKIGPLQLWIRRSEVETCIYHEESPEETFDTVVRGEEHPPEDIKWHRWALGDKSPPLILRPVMPDRPVVVRPEALLSVRENSTGVFYVRIPFRIAVKCADEDEAKTLCEIPTRTLSNTWFGPDTTRGELCYGMWSSVRISLQDVEPAPHRVVCPIVVNNMTNESFELERLCIRTEHLSIFDFEGKLWASRPEITFRGEGRQYLTSYNDDWFEDMEKVQVLSQRRTSLEENILRRSVDGLKSLKNIF